MPLLFSPIEIEHTKSVSFFFFFLENYVIKYKNVEFFVDLPNSGLRK